MQHVTSHPINIRERIYQYQSEHDPEVLLKESGTKIVECIDNKEFYLFDTESFKTVSVHEFTNGILMCDALPDKFRTFAIEMMRQLQYEYNCQTTSEKATCELATMAFIRTIEYQELMIESENTRNALARVHTCGVSNSLSDMKQCLACNRAKIEEQHYVQLGKELDRANRHYFSAIHTLRMMKAVPIQVTIRTDTTVINNQQFVQTNNA